MRTGHIDVDTGKWVDDPEESPSYKTIMTGAGYVHVPQTAKPIAAPVSTPEPAEQPLSVVDKARMIQSRRQGR